MHGEQNIKSALMLPHLFLWYHICSYGILSALMVPFLSLWNNICGNITVLIISYLCLL